MNKSQFDAQRIRAAMSGSPMPDNKSIVQTAMGGRPTKRETIIDEIGNKYDLDPEAAEAIVVNGLRELMKEGLVTRGAKYGYYV